MNWPLYKKHKKKILWAFALNISLIAVLATVLLTKTSPCGCSSKAAKVKSRMKQLGIAISIYFYEGNLQYPKNPRALKIDQDFLYTDKVDNWYDLNLNSPYYFFPDENHKYTGAATVPIATNWEPVIYKNKEYFWIVYEDGHVEYLSREKQLELFQSAYRSRVTKELYDLSSRNNQALQ